MGTCYCNEVAAYGKPERVDRVGGVAEIRRGSGSDFG